MNIERTYSADCSSHDISLDKQIFKGHTGWIESLKINEDCLISGGGGIDETIRCWDIKSRDSLFIARGHRDSVSCLKVANKVLFSSAPGFREKDIFSWESKTGRRLATLSGHTHSIRCLNTAENKLYSGSDDRTIRVWDINSVRETTILTTSSLRVFEDHLGPVTCIKFKDGRLFSGSLDKKIRIFDMEKGVLLSTLQGHTGSIVSLALDKDCLISGSRDYRICMWDIREGEAKPVYSSKGTSGVSSFKIFDNKIAASYFGEQNP